MGALDLGEQKAKLVNVLGSAHEPGLASGDDVPERTDSSARARPIEVELISAEAAANAETDADDELLVRLGRGGFVERHPLARFARLSVWLCVCAFALPLWAGFAAIEAVAAGRGSMRWKMVAWRFVSLVWEDAIVVACALLPSSYGRHTIWCFPPSRSNGCCALTIDDAPGRDPHALCELLDILRDAGARATFFVTTDYAECLVHDSVSESLAAPAKEEWRCAVRAALVRLVREGHELGHHMPQDRPYASLCQRDEGAFRAELARAERVLRAIAAEAGLTDAGRAAGAQTGSAQADAGAPAADAPPSIGASADGSRLPSPPLAHAGFSAKWFRPPSAVLSARMAAIVRGCGYRIVLCDAYSADPWIDGGAVPQAHVCHFHASWLGAVMRSGSIAVLHTPERASRRQTITAVRGLLPALAEKGLRAVTLSELAAQVLAAPQ